MRRAFGWFFEAVFPAKCLVCDREGSWLCEVHGDFPSGSYLGRSLEGLESVWVGTDYADDRVKRLIEIFKYRGGRGMEDYLLRGMTPFFVNKKFDHVVLVPIPLHRTRLMWRGFNQSQILALGMEKRGWGKVCDGLVKRRKTRVQAQLTKKERLINVQGVFEVKKGTKWPNVVVLVDDVVTTGATMQSAAKILKKAGVKEVYGVVVAGKLVSGERN